jgi:lipid II:glycine glycyltransferase (peptidoglycan interpeptide bridge formation enzyme)
VTPGPLAPGRLPTGQLRVVTLSPEEHLAYVRSQPSVSFLQTPAWGEVKAEWRAESLGWIDATGRTVGAGLVLHRPVPRLPRSLAYLPEGPDIDWADPDLRRWLDPMAEHLRRAGAFAVRMGPPVVTRSWSTGTLKHALADEGVRRLGDVPPDALDERGAELVLRLRSLGWQPPPQGEGFAAGQPRYVFQLPLAGRTEADVLAGANQLWRRNIKKADKAGVEVVEGGEADLGAFHELYVETARRDGFTPRPLAYFTTMWRALRAEDPHRLRLYLARHDGDLVAATTMTMVGDHAWYSYGASSTAKREVRASNAVQWRMVRDALSAGCRVYDMRGITDTLDADDPHAGLIRFKLGTGGEAVEYVGEWTLPVSKLLARAFDAYMARRGG